LAGDFAIDARRRWAQHLRNCGLHRNEERLGVERDARRSASAVGTLKIERYRNDGRKDKRLEVSAGVSNCWRRRQNAGRGQEAANRTVIMRLAGLTFRDFRVTATYWKKRGVGIVMTGAIVECPVKVATPGK
jgi:hypothetical protein